VVYFVGTQKDNFFIAPTKTGSLKSVIALMF